MSVPERPQHPNRTQILSRTEHHQAIEQGEAVRAARQQILSSLTRAAIEHERHRTTPQQVESAVGKNKVAELFGADHGAEIVANELNRRMATMERDYHAPGHSGAQIRASLSLDTPALQLT